MWSQIVCFLILTLQSKSIASVVEPRELIPCCSIKVPPKSHDSYYEEDEYYKPKRYGYGDHHIDHRHVDHSKNVGYKPINPPNHPAKYSEHTSNYIPKSYRNQHDNNRQDDAYHNNDHYKNYGYKLNTPYNQQIAHKYNDGHDKFEANKLNKYQHDHEYYKIASYKRNHDDDDNDHQEKYDDIKKQHRGYEDPHNDHHLNTYLKTAVHKEDQDKSSYDDLLSELLQNHLPHTYLPTTYYNPDEKHSKHPKPLFDYLLPGILRRLQDFKQKTKNGVQSKKIN